MMDDYSKFDAIDLANLIQNKDVTASEVIEAAIKRAEAVNPDVNAICLLYTSPSPRDVEESRMPSSA